MSRFFKITGISLIFIVLTVFLAVGITLKCIVTPSRLTPIVRQVADKIITCQYGLGEVDITFFSTFPEFGLRIKDLYFINPIAGLHNDTLATVSQLTAIINVTEYLDDNNLHIKELRLEGVGGNVFINETGENNFSIFNLNSDSVSKEITDTTAFVLPFDNIWVDNISLKTSALAFVNKKDSIDLQVANIDLKARINNLEDVYLCGKIHKVIADIGKDRYADGLDIAVDVPLSVNMDSLCFKLGNSSLSVNEYALSVKGDIQMLNNIDLDVHVSLADWQIARFIKILPPTLLPSLLTNPDSLNFDCLLSFNAHVFGTYKDSIFPVIDASLKMRKGEFQYVAIPYKITDVATDLNAHLDLNKGGDVSFVSIENFSAKTKNSSLALKGQIYDLLGDMLLNINSNTNITIADFSPFLPANTDIKGKIKGELNTKIRLSDIEKQRLDKGVIVGNLQLENINVAMDSMIVDMPVSHLNFRIPNRKSVNKSSQWLELSLSFDTLNFTQTNTVESYFGKSDITVELSDILRNKSTIYGGLSLHSAKTISATMDSIDGKVDAPSLSANFEYNLHDTTVLPTLSVKLDFNDLQGNFYGNRAHLLRSTLSLMLGHRRRDKSAPQLQANLTSTTIVAQIGDEIGVKTKDINIEAKAKYNKLGENILTKWHPKLQFNLKDAIIDISSFGEQIKIPTIDFTYSNKECNISESRFIIGNSDFSLNGNIKNIGRWLQKRDTLVGVLNFSSDQADINELMSLCSANKGSEDNSTAITEMEKSTDSNENEIKMLDKPFLVPTHVDLTLNTQIKKANVFNEDVKDIGGRLYIKNGKLVLEEMGFVCKAAKLQLTALYRTPHRDDIYVGFDYHMLDVDIEELIALIPQLDTLLPMLKSFRGLAEFHLAGETYVNDKYKIKPSTLRGACSLFAKDLVVLDGETFSEISKLLKFRKKTENKIDSISAEVTLYKNDIDIYPFCVTMDKYLVAIGGRHNLDMTFNYHVNLLSPLYIGVNVGGNLDNLNIKLGKCVYAKDFKPIFHHKTETEAMQMRKIIRNSMQRNVKIEHKDIRNK